MAEQTENSKKITRRAETAPVPPEKLCTLCGEKKKENGSDYCRDCKRELEKIKPPVLGYILTAAIVCVTIAAGVLSFMNYAPEKRMAEAKAAARQLRLTDAYNAYEDAYDVAASLNTELKSIFPRNLIFVGHLARKGEMKVYSEIYGDDFAGSKLNSYFSKKEVESDPELLGYSESYQIFQRAQTLVTEIFTDCSAGKITCEQAVEKIKALEKDNPDLLGWLIFFECDAEAEFGDGDRKNQVEYMQRLKAAAPELSEIYAPVLIESFFALGRYDECLDVCDSRLAQNRNDMMPAVIKLKIAFVGGDIEEAKKITGEYVKNNKNTDRSAVLEMMLHRFTGDTTAAFDNFQRATDLGFTGIEMDRQQALNFLADGRYQLAFQRAFSAYSASAEQYTAMATGGVDFSLSDLIETLYLTAMLYSRENPDEAANEIYLSDVIDFFTSEDGAYIPGEKTASILNGELSLKDALTKGTGDII